MTKATIRDYGKVDFDPMCYDNNAYDLYAIAICDPETNLVESEEHYTSIDSYRDALYHTEGREVGDEQEECGFCQVDYDGCTYECEATYHIAYVFDHEEE